MVNLKGKGKDLNIQQDLLDLMRRFDLSREDVASRLGVSAMTIYRWQYGKTLPKSRIAISALKKFRRELEKIDGY